MSHDNNHYLATKTTYFVLEKFIRSIEKDHIL